MQEKIMEEMIEKNESLRIEGKNVIIRPEAVKDKLKEKLSVEDIITGASSVMNIVEFNQLQMNLCGQCSQLKCNSKAQCCTRSKPNGSPTATVMFINKMPSAYEAAAGTSFSDEKGMFLSLILQKMNVDRGMVYMTDYIKCCNMQIDQESFKTCSETYLMKELEIVDPKLIICNGMSVMKTMATNKIIFGLPETVTYGNIYDVVYSVGRNAKIMCIYDLERVLQKTGSDFAECKNNLWKQFLTGFNSIGGIKWIQTK